MAGERKRCLDAGADDYVPKPVDQAELLAALRPWLPHAPSSPPVAGPTVAPAPSVAPRRGLRVAGARPTSLRRDRGQRLEGLKILVVDDDFRNIFAMTAVLERGRRHGDRRRERRRGDRRPGADAGHRHRPDGHHDAGHGRLRHDPRHPADQPLRGRFPSSRSPARPRPANASAASTPEPTTTSRSRSTPPSSSRPSGRGCRLLRRRSRRMSIATRLGRAGRRRRRGRSAAGPSRSSSSTTTPAKRLALKAVLAPLGYDIVEADSGAAALRCVMAEDFAVILLDVRMPIMDGFETAALIRLRRQSEMTPIIFITAHGRDEIGTDRYAAGRGRLHLRTGRRRTSCAPRSRCSRTSSSRRRRSPPRRASVQVLRRPAEAAHRGRPDRHLPDRRRERVHLHQPALDRDHRRPGRRGDRARLGRDRRLGGARRFDHGVASTRTYPVNRLAGSSRSSARGRPPGSCS